MPNLTADEVITQKHKRLFIQFGGPYPGNSVKYYGQDAQYMSVEGVSIPGSGGIDAIWEPEEFTFGKTKVSCSIATAVHRKNPLCVNHSDVSSLPALPGVLRSQHPLW